MEEGEKRDLLVRIENLQTIKQEALQKMHDEMDAMRVEIENKASEHEKQLLRDVEGKYDAEVHQLQSQLKDLDNEFSETVVAFSA